MWERKTDIFKLFSLFFFEELKITSLLSNYKRIK